MLRASRSNAVVLSAAGLPALRPWRSPQSRPGKCSVRSPGGPSSCGVAALVASIGPQGFLADAQRQWVSADGVVAPCQELGLSRGRRTERLPTSRWVCICCTVLKWPTRLRCRIRRRTQERVQRLKRMRALFWPARILARRPRLARHRSRPAPRAPRPRSSAPFWADSCLHPCRVLCSPQKQVSEPGDRVENVESVYWLRSRGRFLMRPSSACRSRLRRLLSMLRLSILSS